MIFTLPHIIERSAEKFPDREAFRSGNRSVTYEALHRQMHQLSRLLQELGVRRGDCVGVYMNRSLETAAAIYGIMHAGAAYVPLDPHAPPARTRYLLKNCGIRHLVTDPTQRRSLTPVVEVNTDLNSVTGLDADWPVKTISWDEVAQMPGSVGCRMHLLDQDLAYIMYTSGSTGTPKGIMHTHHSGLSYASLSAHLYGLQPDDRIGNHAPLHFDISTLGYFSAPLAGATTVIIPEAHTKMAASLSRLMEKEKLTVWYSVPLALVQLLLRGDLPNRDLSTIRWVLFGGEPFPSRHLRSLIDQWPQARFSNVYGPAEVNQCTYYHLQKPPQPEDPVPVGRAWNNTEIMIVDEKDRKVEVGETGELVVRTATMMAGYWQQPELTERSLLRKSSDSGIEKVYYRTGDLFQWREDGLLYFQGRKDRQIKIRGYRVELDEIEAVLTAHEAIEEAAVVTVPDEVNGLFIEAVVIVTRNADISAEKLRNYAGEHLPWYAVPRQITLTTTLPRTPTGKIDRPKLQHQLTQLSNT